MFLNAFIQVKGIIYIYERGCLKVEESKRVSLSPLKGHKCCHNFSDTPSGICLCNQGIEDTSYFLFSRHLYATQRVTLVSSVNEIIQKFNLNYLKTQLQLHLYGNASLNNTGNKKIILSTIKYIKDTRRFST